MKRFCAYTVLTVVFAAASVLYAEDWGGGLRLGLTFGKLEAENAPTLNTGFGAGIGIMLGYPLSKNFSLVSGIDMTDMGLGYYKNVDDEEVSIRNGVFSVPLTIRFQIDQSFPLYLALGGQFDLPFYSKAVIGEKGYAIKDRAFGDFGLSAGIGYAMKEENDVRPCIDFRYIYNINPAFNEISQGGAGKNSLSYFWVGFSVVGGLFMTETRAERTERIARTRADNEAWNAKHRAELAEREARDAERAEQYRARRAAESAARSESRSETEQVLLERGMIVLDAVYFETGKAEIHRNSKPYLKTIAKMLVKYPKLRLEIGGHTDNTGSQQVNMTLSQKRADAVAEFMRAEEPALAGMLSAKGYGPTEPKADNNTADGRETNRRVELKVLNPDVLAEYK